MQPNLCPCSYATFLCRLICGKYQTQLTRSLRDLNLHSRFIQFVKLMRHYDFNNSSTFTSRIRVKLYTSQGFIRIFSEIFPTIFEAYSNVFSKFPYNLSPTSHFLLKDFPTFPLYHKLLKIFAEFLLNINQNFLNISQF